MNRVTFSIVIDAPKELVWRTMLEDATYREWTSPFAEGSYAVTDWKEGSKALFLTPSGEGMVSKIAAHRPNEFLSIKHLGTVKNGVEDTESQEAKGWGEALENYSITEANGSSTLKIEMDATDEYKSYFEETWPKALSKLQEIAEREAQAERGRRQSA
ncbi:MAG TPA: SRPBCC domain-containing protein [Terriglobales bacterium]|nr:SRPBCC domain-containing protein [Terriglobales bacterium]